MVGSQGMNPIGQPHSSQQVLCRLGELRARSMFYLYTPASTVSESHEWSIKFLAGNRQGLLLVMGSHTGTNSAWFSGEAVRGHVLFSERSSGE